MTRLLATTGGTFTVLDGKLVLDDALIERVERVVDAPAPTDEALTIPPGFVAPASYGTPQ